MKSERTTTFDDNSGLVSMECGDEVWREYDFVDPNGGGPRVYRVEKPVAVEYHLAGTTHRVFDNEDVMHVLPAPGYCGCVIRIKQTPDSL